MKRTRLEPSEAPTPEHPRLRDRRELAEMLEELLEISRESRALRRATRGRERELPQLLDCRTLADELGIKLSAAEAIMRKVPTVHFEGLRRTYVRGDHVLAFIERSTRSDK